MWLIIIVIELLSSYGYDTSNQSNSKIISLVLACLARTDHISADWMFFCESCDQVTDGNSCLTTELSS